MTKKILILDADAGAAAQMRSNLTGLGYTVCGVLTCGVRAIEQTAVLGPDLVMVDAALTGAVDGAEAAAVIGRRYALPVIYLVDAAADELPPRAWDAAPYGCALKSGDRRQLRLIVENALNLHATRTRPTDHLIETVFNSISDGVVATDMEGNFLFVNESATQIVGMDVRDSTPDEWSETYGTFHRDGKTPFPSEELPLARGMRGEHTEEVELFIRNRQRPHGVYINVIGRPLQDPDRGHLGGVIVFRDVTHHKETESRLQRTLYDLQRQNELMETVFESISDGVIAIDDRGKYLIFNSSAKQIIGRYEPGTPLDRRSEVYGLFRPGGKTRFPSNELPLTRALRGEATDQVQMIVRNRSRPYVHISVSGRPLPLANGSAAAGVIVFRDVTAIKQFEQELRDNAHRLRTQTQALETVLNSVSDGVVAADEAGAITIFNPSAERIAGFGRLDSTPDRWGEDYGVYYPDRVTPVAPDDLPLTRALRGEESDDVDLYVRSPRIPDGVYISVSGRPLRDESGRRRGGVIAFRDVTARMRAEEALHEAFAHGRLEIVDTVLHNIGNAINSVAIGVDTLRTRIRDRTLLQRLSSLAQAADAHRDDWLDYLQHDSQGQQVRPFIVALAADFESDRAAMERTAGRVADRVSHIVDIVRTQRGLERRVAVRKHVALRATIDAAVRLMHDSVSSRNITITIECLARPQTIHVDESRFQQMLINLIKNAMDAIDELVRAGGLRDDPRIRIRCYPQAEFLVIDVIDNGIGIDGKEFTTIFAAGYTTKEGGSGLGLHSAANFVIGSGGRIHPLSDGVGHGTTMRVMLRLSAVAPDAAAG